MVVPFSGPGMNSNDLDLSGLSNFKLTRHTRNVANLLDVCAESVRAGNCGVGNSKTGK